MSQPSPSPVSPFLQFFLPFFFFFFLLLPIVKLSAEEQLCNSPTVCERNNMPISHPFWRIDGSDDEGEEEEDPVCRPRNFGVSCSNADPDYPLLTINGHDYLVRNISYPERSITLLDSQLIHLQKDDCSPWGQLQKQSLDLLETAPFSYASRIDLNITFFSNCTRPPPNEIPRFYGIGCDSYLFVGRIDPLGLDWTRNCKGKIETAVMRTEENQSGKWEWNASFRAAMEQGFVLYWNYSSSQTHHKGGLSPRSKIAIGIGVGGAFGAIAIGAWWFLNKKKKKSDQTYVSSYFMSRSIGSDPSDLEKAGDYHGVQRFDYSELEAATENFHPKHELGDGGFGSVYKGKLRDGRVVAVKRLYENNCRRVEQFMNEIEILHRLSHKNLVRLYGCTSRHSRELILVYEYIPNGTIADHLHGEAAGVGRLSWATRLNIAVETASALAYLHASEVIHRDVKTNNILLDDGFRVKVADFGLSRLFPTHATHVSTAPQGTPGYLDPEYHECYQLTSKSDVYSFGVVLVELISGLPAVDITRHRHEINLSNMAIARIQCNALHEIVDRTLGFESDERVRGTVCAVAEVAFQCLQGGKDMRPTMGEVLESLVEIQSLDALGKEEKKVSSVMGSPLVDAPLLCSSKTSTDNSSNNVKNVPALSPNSVIAKWPSRSTTHSSSA
ncbi:hypothetical protein DM860_010300 [Cuscuta australis]|uniref:Protein kinase domain-containing protein n=1 Tax=Cuscuta australis TaxID=267555 RepID=A0A328D7I6_9ASTE|nr:hypothetical protein DM860_010300 [Cuscuta australis]